MASSFNAFPAAAVCTLFLAVATAPAAAQSGGAPADKPAEGAKAPTEEKLRVGPIENGPEEARRPECLWTGQRIVSLLWRDDVNTALQHTQVYDRWGCPNDHLKKTFACLVGQGDFDPQGSPSLAARIFACWTDPERKSAPDPAP